MMLGKLFSIWDHLMIWKHRRYVLSQVNSGMYLGKNVMICPGIKFDPPLSFLTSIGDNCYIAPDVRILNHDASLFVLAKFAKIGKIDIKANCFIGAGSLLLPGITIGPNAIVGAYSVVTKNVEPDTVVAGNPAKFIKKTSEHIVSSKNDLETGKYPGYNSNEMYPSLYNETYREKVVNEMKNGIAFTIGTDKNFSFHFNRGE